MIDTTLCSWDNIFMSHIVTAVIAGAIIIQFILLVWVTKNYLTYRRVAKQVKDLIIFTPEEWKTFKKLVSEEISKELNNRFIIREKDGFNDSIVNVVVKPKPAGIKLPGENLDELRKIHQRTEENLRKSE